MTGRPAVALLGVAAMLLATCDAGPRSGRLVDVTLIGNAGFLMRGTAHAVLIDALLPDASSTADTFRSYPTRELQARLLDRAGEIPPIDLALTTHVHADHGDSGVAAAFLLARPRAILIAPTDVLGGVLDAGGPEVFHQLVGRADGDDRSPRIFSWTGGSVTVLPSYHSGYPRLVLENFMFAVDLDGVRLLHVGDAPPTGETFADIDPSLLRADIAFLPLWFITDSEGRRLISVLLRPQRIVLMHMPVGRMSEAESRVRQVLEQGAELPPISILTTPGDTVTISLLPRSDEPSRVWP